MLSSSVSVRETKVCCISFRESARSARGGAIREGPLSALSSRSPDQKLSYRLPAKSMATSHNQTTIRIAVTKLQQLRDRAAMLLAFHRLLAPDALGSSIISSSHLDAARP
jgi:hypothetical protein